MATPPTTTLFPLTGCFASCGPLYDANGACVPPVNTNNDPSAWNSCFCGYGALKPFATGTAGVCDGTCADATGMSSVQSWYSSFCGVKGAQETVSTTATGTDSSATSKATGQGLTVMNNTNNGSWISNHYQWVIFLIIMVLAIVGIWVGACIWRKKYLAKRDRQYALGKNMAHATESGRIVPNASQAGSIHVPSAGMFAPAPIASAGVYDQEKLSKSRNKWAVNERT